MAFEILPFPVRRVRGREPAHEAPAVSDERVNVLLLGGAAEAPLIAERLAARPELHLLTSIAGREDGGNVPVDGDVRIGGFADAQALTAFVLERRISLLVDACDPFRPRLRRYAAHAALHTGVNRLVFESPVCEEHEDDTWIRVRDCAEAADLLPGFASRVMLHVPRADLDAFARLQDIWFLLRGAGGVDDGVPLARFERVPASVGESVEQEQSILRQHAVQLVLTAETGCGPLSHLLQASRALRLPVMLIERPPLPPSEVVHDVEQVLAWVDARLAESGRLPAPREPV